MRRKQYNRYKDVKTRPLKQKVENLKLDLMDAQETLNKYKDFLMDIQQECDKNISDRIIDFLEKN